MKTPDYILARFEKASIGLEHGTVTLRLHVRDGLPRYTIGFEESIFPDEELGLGKTYRQVPDKGKPQIYQYIMGLTY